MRPTRRVATVPHWVQGDVARSPKLSRKPPRHPVVDGSNFDHFKLSKLPKLLTLKAISTLKALKAQLTTIVEGFKRKLRSPR